MSSVHGARGGAFEVDPLAVIAAAMTRTLELVFAGLPVGRATEMRATRIDHEYPIGRAIDPDAILLLKLGIDSERELRGISNFENRVGFEKSARKKEPEEGQEPRSEKCRYAHPDQATTAAVDVSIGWTRGRKSRRCRGF